MPDSSVAVDSRSRLTIVAYEFGQPVATIDLDAPPALDRRVHHALPAITLQGTRDLATEKWLSLSRTALSLQVTGLAWVVTHVGWRTLLHWRRPHGNPRALHDLGIPQPWLSALVGETSTAHRAHDLFRPDVSPIVYPPTRGVVYSQPDLWHRVVQEAARSLEVPAGHLLGLLQTAGLLAYHMDLPPSQHIFAPGVPHIQEYLGLAALALAHVTDGQDEEAVQITRGMIEDESK